MLPLLHGYAYLSLSPFSVPLPGNGNQQITLRIGDSAEMHQNASIHLIGLSEQEIVSKVQSLLTSKNQEETLESAAETLATVGLRLV